MTDQSNRRGCALRAVFFDFDSTLSTPIFIARARRWAVADDVSLFTQMSNEERLANLGGPARVAQLAALFTALAAGGVRLYIVSIGYRVAFAPHLEAAGLLRFFGASDVYGQEAPELRAVRFVKGALIAQIMAERGWRARDALFIDDSIEHIQSARPVCRTLHVEERKGMTDATIEQVRAIGLGLVHGDGAPQLGEDD